MIFKKNYFFFHFRDAVFNSSEVSPTIEQVDQTFGAFKAAGKYEATRLFNLIVSVRHEQIEDYTGITDLDSLQWDHFTISLQRMGGPIL